MSYPNIERHMANALDPEWASFDADRKHVHDWRTYVTDEVRKQWEAIPVLGRCAVIDCCQDAADREHWG